ncbi:MAG: Hsp20/alpha crystallin family protein [Desulfobacteraceae bacterium]|nr:MAG: Hsp20/alpha crystallin family protein [Desulfobacteraceae bacterium]
MPGLILWKNEEINKLKKDMDRLFTRMWDDFGIRLSPSGMGGFTFLDMSETEEVLVIQAEIPGVDLEDLDVSISDDLLLTIKWKSREEMEEETENSYAASRRIRAFSRSFRLPCKVRTEEVEATYKGGVLSVILPKCRTESPREIKVKIQQA